MVRAFQQSVEQVACRIVCSKSIHYFQHRPQEMQTNFGSSNVPAVSNLALGQRHPAQIYSSIYCRKHQQERALKRTMGIVRLLINSGMPRDLGTRKFVQKISAAC